MERALAALQEVAFLPKKLADGSSILVKITDEFAIPDHARYGNAFAGHDVLLDFRVDEVSSLHVLFRHFEIDTRYLSASVKEASTVGNDFSENECLSRELRAKAYALYW